jgi:cytochrome P450
MLDGIGTALRSEGLLSPNAHIRDDAGQMNELELLTSLQLLILAGYETTVNSITNGTLTLLRHAHHLSGLIYRDL